MAYRDIDGRITIDEVAAMSDINKTLEAADKLRRSGAVLQQIIAELQQYQGETVNGTIEKSQEMLRNVNNLLNNLDKTQDYIRRVVAHYRAVDAQCREMLLNNR